MSWNPKQRKTETRYSANNPPADRETAERKANDLKSSISFIEIDLEDREVESFPDEAAYEDWRRRALGALVHIKTEALFLEEWLTLQKKKAALQVITDRIADMAKNVQAQSNDLQHPPPSPEEARRRLRALTELRDGIGDEYARLMDSGRDASLSKREVAERLSPLRVLIEAIEQERRSTKGYIFANDPTSRKEEEPLPVLAQKILEFAQVSATALGQECLEISGSSNPPPDLNDAKRRRKALSDVRSRITHSLQTVAEMWQEHPYSGGTLKAVKRPLVALHTSVNEEIRYLDGCIEEFHRMTEEKEREVQKERKAAAAAAKNTADAGRYDELQRTNLDIRKRAEELAVEIRDSYSSLYTIERSPADLDEARQRQVLASEAKLRLQAAFAEITDAWCRHPLSRRELSGVKRPLTKILDGIELELGIAKRFITDRTPQIPPADKRRWWKSVCVAALTRATFEGFKLTDEERTVIQELVANLGGKP